MARHGIIAWRNVALATRKINGAYARHQSSSGSVSEHGWRYRRSIESGIHSSVFISAHRAMAWQASAARGALSSVSIKA